MHFIRILLTERDNKSPCIVRFMWVVVFVHLLALTGFALIKGQPFDFGADVRAWCEFLACASLGIAGKALTEKKE